MHGECAAPLLSQTCSCIVLKTACGYASGHIMGDLHTSSLRCCVLLQLTVCICPFNSLKSCIAHLMEPGLDERALPPNGLMGLVHGLAGLCLLLTGLMGLIDGLAGLCLELTGLMGLVDGLPGLCRVLDGLSDLEDVLVGLMKAVLLVLFEAGNGLASLIAVLSALDAVSLPTALVRGTCMLPKSEAAKGLLSRRLASWRTQDKDIRLVLCARSSAVCRLVARTCIQHGINCV